MSQYVNGDSRSVDLAVAESLDFRNVLSKISKVRDRFRDFAVPADRAAVEFQITHKLQEALLLAGMPNRSRGGTIFFDSTDLLNIALHLEIGSPQRKLLAWWTHELSRPYGEFTSYRMDYVARCPQPHHAGECTYRIVEPNSSFVEITSNDPSPQVRHSTTLTIRRKWPELQPNMLELIDSVRDIGFLWLPGDLRHDVDFIQQEKVADCVGVAKILNLKAASLGVTARHSAGRALTPPFSSPHSWAEFLVDDIWVPVDPVFIDALLEWELLEKGKWTRHSSIGGILVRIGAACRTSVFHNGQPIRAQYPVYRA